MVLQVLDPDKGTRSDSKDETQTNDQGSRSGGSTDICDSFPGLERKFEARSDPFIVLFLKQNICTRSIVASVADPKGWGDLSQPSGLHQDPKRALG
jgi:hypothetical protein